MQPARGYQFVGNAPQMPETLAWQPRGGLRLGRETCAQLAPPESHGGVKSTVRIGGWTWQHGFAVLGKDEIAKHEPTKMTSTRRSSPSSPTLVTHHVLDPWGRRHPASPHWHVSHPTRIGAAPAPCRTARDREGVARGPKTPSAFIQLLTTCKIKHCPPTTRPQHARPRPSTHEPSN
jgi:hypothetical protein